LQEAEEFAEQDRAVKARVDAKNQLESYAYQMKSTVEDSAKDKVGGSVRGGAWAVCACWMHQLQAVCLSGCLLMKYTLWSTVPEA
jgi:hypothetical protein